VSQRGQAVRHGRRAFVIVLDACGVGALPDADAYGDAGTDTLGHLAQDVGGLELPALARLGLGSIAPLQGVPPAAQPVLHGRLRPLGPGKDSTAGHWELMGVVTPQELPVYPDGFPPEVVALVTAASGREVICNQPYNGVGAIEDFGSLHLSTGALIVYTSQDSVLQIAAHVDAVEPNELYRICERVRGELPGQHRVGRVIARPFAGTAERFVRTDGRRDFSIPPPGPSYLEALAHQGVAVHAVGKTGQLFCGIGIDVQHPGATNRDAMEHTGALIDSLHSGLVFTNLIETDQVYGHRHDAAGFHRALREIDASVGEWLSKMREGDLFVLTADHGCDLRSPLTDHTREYAPLLAAFDGHRSRRHDGLLADVGASVFRWLTSDQTPQLPGEAFV
jgi:phosphopentomutase